MHYNSYQCCPLLLWAPSLSKSDRLSFLACIYVTIKLQSSPAHFGKFWRHSTNREAKSISNAFGHFVFGVLKIRMNETPVFDLDAYSTLHRKTLTHILPFGRCELCDFVALTGISKRESCVFYLGRGFFKFFSFDVCFVTFRLFLLLFLDEPFTCAK